MLRKKDRIIAKIWQCGAKKFAKTTTKFGIECPKTVHQTMDLEKKNGNNSWADAIAKETKNARVDSEIREKGDPPPVGHKFIK